MRTCYKNSAMRTTKAELIAQGIEEGVIDNTELGCADENGNIIAGTHE